MVVLQSRHPLVDAAAFGIEMPGPTHLELVVEARIHTVMPFRGHGKVLAQRLKRLKSVSLRTAGPDDWLMVTTDRVPDIDPAQALVVDQSHGRTLFRLRGPRAISILMKGVAIDLPGDALPVGTATSLQFEHIPVNLARIEETVFEIIVMRSYAESLRHALSLAGREFGMTTGAA